MSLLEKMTLTSLYTCYCDEYYMSHCQQLNRPVSESGSLSPDRGTIFHNKFQEFQMLDCYHQKLNRLTNLRCVYSTSQPKKEPVLKLINQIGAQFIDKCCYFQTKIQLEPKMAYFSCYEDYSLSFISFQRKSMNSVLFYYYPSCCARVSRFPYIGKISVGKKDINFVYQFVKDRMPRKKRKIFQVGTIT